jgi:lipoate-protein ligase A
MDEEARLAEAGTPSVRVGRLSERALSLGVAQAADAICAKVARDLGIPVVRRRTGGLGVLHEPGDVVFSVILPRHHPQVGRDYHRAYARLGAGVVRFLARQGVDSAWRPPPGLPTELCLLARRGESLYVGDRVLGGAAQRLTARVLTHHGTLLGGIDSESTSRVFDLPRETVDSLLTDLAAQRLAASESADLDQLARDLRDALERPREAPTAA